MEREGHRLTKIYTRTGDAGTTRLVGGQELLKADLRIESYGTVDELSSVLGVARAVNRARPAEADGRGDIEGWLCKLQNDLFVLGGDLAMLPEDRPAGLKTLTAADATRLEAQIDQLNQTLGPLNDFILPCGGLLGAQLHVARTVCRRAERCVVALAQQSAVDPVALQYLNRLSDYLFVLARWATRCCGESEDLWDRSA